MAKLYDALAGGDTARFVKTPAGSVEISQDANPSQGDGLTLDADGKLHWRPAGAGTTVLDGDVVGNASSTSVLALTHNDTSHSFAGAWTSGQLLAIASDGKITSVDNTPGSLVFADFAALKPFSHNVSGTDLVSTANGVLNVDDSDLAVGQTVLVLEHNALYRVTIAGSSSAPWRMVRVSTSGLYYVRSGTYGAGRLFSESHEILTPLRMADDPISTDADIVPGRFYLLDPLSESQPTLTITEYLRDALRHTRVGVYLLQGSAVVESEGDAYVIGSPLSTPGYYEWFLRDQGESVAWQLIQQPAVIEDSAPASDLVDHPSAITSSATLMTGKRYRVVGSPSGVFLTLSGTGRIGLRLSGAANSSCTLTAPHAFDETGTPSMVLNTARRRYVEFTLSSSETWASGGHTPMISTPNSVTSGNLAVWNGTNGLALSDGGAPGSGDGGGDDGGDDGDDGGGDTPVSSSMKISAQPWFHVQRDAAQYQDDSLTWTGDRAMKITPAINWSTAYGSTSGAGSLAATNIWRPETLALWQSIQGPIRFMDWGATNYSPLTTWSQRQLPTDNNYESYGTPDSSSTPITDPSVRGMAYEWMVDLCNRTMKDMWVCVPHQADDNYVTQMATVINNHLHPNLKVYLEYSNEYWNFGSGSLNVSSNQQTATGGNHRAQNDHVILQGQAQGLPGSNVFYKGGAFGCKRSYEIWYLFGQVFGGFDRIVRTLCTNGNNDLMRQGLVTTYTSSTWNPHSMTCDLICTAPYIEGQTLSAWNTSLNQAWAPFGNCYEVRQIATQFSIPAFGAYEGGIQAAGSGVNTWAASADIYNAYISLYNKCATEGMSLFCHYTLIGASSATAAWGLLTSSTESTTTAHRWRATLDWMDANP